MRDLDYSSLQRSLELKSSASGQPHSCLFELTYQCNFRCIHCFSDCYNNPECVSKEINTKEIKLILDNLHRAGIIWLNLSGGDPLMRKDFQEIYAYAKNKGFIIKIYTNASLVNPRLIKYFKKCPPYLIEVSFNAATKGNFEKIAQKEGAFECSLRGISLISKAKLPLLIKTRVLKANFGQLPKINEFCRGLGVRFSPSPILHARLNGDNTPCRLRITPRQVVSLKQNIFPNDANVVMPEFYRKKYIRSIQALFFCDISCSRIFNVDPYGDTFPCALIREPRISLLEHDINEAINMARGFVRGKKFLSNSKCKGCDLKETCINCPGVALLETGNMEAPIDYSCKLAKLLLHKENRVLY